VTSVVRPSIARILWDYTEGLRGRLSALLLLNLVSYLAVLAQPLVARSLLAELAAGAHLAWGIAALGTITVVSAVLMGTSSLLLGRMSLRVVLDARTGMVSGLLRAGVTAIQRRPIGDVLSRLGGDTMLVRNALTEAMVRGAVAPLAMLVTVVLLVRLDLAIALVLVSVLAAGIAFEWFALGRLRRASADAQVRIGIVLSTLQRVLTAFRTVKAFGMAGQEERNIVGHVTAVHQRNLVVTRWSAIVESTGNAVIDLMFLVALAMGAVRIASGQMTFGDLVAFLLYVTYLRGPATTTLQCASMLAQGVSALRRVEEIRSIPPEPDLDDRPTGQRAPGGAAGLVLRDVRFSYGDTPVLNGVTLCAARGLTVLVGRSGIGKTTVLNLVERFLDVDAGQILLDGKDIRDLSRTELRLRLAYVEQEAPLLGDTVRDAVAYGAPDATDRDVDDVLTSVGLRGWVDRLPDGVHTAVGERGATMSGGQRQRLAVARALLRRADVLLLDEATSQLDSESEAHLLRSLADEARDRTILSVTHRRSVAQRADSVVLLEQGRVRAVGRHDDLLRSDELYRGFLLEDRGTEGLLSTSEDC
jgi:ABC-type multidrug transport system fused ATPase/permease subunit